MRKLLLIFIAGLAAALATQPAFAGETVYVIRHLEKATGDDPALTARGAERADQLAQLLAKANIKAVFVTPTRRARETATPLANRLGLPVSEYNPRDVEALAAAVSAAAGPVLIVGHSNTVAALVARFGGDRPAELTEQDYGTLFVVHSGTKQVNRIRLN
ncbi:phosphoglycerate mutase family protein [Sphingomonas hankyongi]|uniref:Histidine phosphatase family protein n=1 Tax=Sphingomonas hankyongi TaxID=2908209 RepID=A0ABT0S1M3_9SPHN|nr:phosphoglycerate mutase family protein [Sphingomonas hankyongi]MCL6729721.1 histidine phosphatase family protein [Sphingomonas hankyongi]